MKLKRLIGGHGKRLRTVEDGNGAEVVPVELPEVELGTPADSVAATEHHVATQALKRQFEERLAARKRRRRGGN